MDMVRVEGGCHCGAVHFEAMVEPRSEVHVCNCSICRMVGFQHLIVPASRFELMSGAEGLREYRYGTGTAKHLFCSVCGVKSFYVPRSNPDGISLNVRCLKNAEDCTFEFIDFDGQNWSKNAERLKHLSSDSPDA